MWGYVQLNKQNGYFCRGPACVVFWFDDMPYYLRSAEELSYLKSRIGFSSSRENEF
jgi:hypothetical protein